MKRYVLVENTNNRPTGLRIIAEADTIIAKANPFRPGLEVTLKDEDKVQQGSAHLHEQEGFKS